MKRCFAVLTLALGIGASTSIFLLWTRCFSFAALAVYNDRLSSVSGGREQLRSKWVEASSGFF